MLAVVLTGPLAAPAPAQGTQETCSFATAGTGTYARTLCWFDMSGYNTALATSPGGQPMTVVLGGYTISFTVTASGGTVTPHAFPTYPGAYLENLGYTGVAGLPALYSDTNAITTLRLSNIVARDAAGNVVTGYSFVGADAESTDSYESLSWTSDQPLQLISNLGNACPTTFTGVGTTTVTCSANVTSTKTGTPILAAQNPSYFQQTMTPRQDSTSSKQAVAFGVLVSTVQFSKQVTGRVNASDSFRVSVSTGGTVLGTADTGTGNTATTGEITVLAGASGQSYVLGETASSGGAGGLCAVVGLYPERDIGFGFGAAIWAGGSLGHRGAWCRRLRELHDH